MAKKSKQTKFQKFYVDLDIYNTDIMFLVGDVEQCREFVTEQHKDSKIKDDLEIIEESFNNHEMTGVTFQTSKGVSIYIESPKDSATVAHEIFHGVCMLMRYKGVQFCSESEEAYAYLIGHITREFYKNVKQMGGKDSK